jgi:hypothetical protein
MLLASYGIGFCTGPNCGDGEDAVHGGDLREKDQRRSGSEMKMKQFKWCFGYIYDHVCGYPSRD